MIPQLCPLSCMCGLAGGVIVTHALDSIAFSPACVEMALGSGTKGFFVECVWESCDLNKNTAAFDSLYSQKMMHT